MAKALRVRNTLDFEDVDGAALCRIQTRVLHIRDTMEIEHPDGSRMALVVRDTYGVEISPGADPVLVVGGHCRRGYEANPEK